MTALNGLRQFEIDCASRGYLAYQEIWKPRIGEKLEIDQDFGNVEDPFAMAIKTQPRIRIHAKCDISIHFRQIDPSFQILG